MGMHHKIKKLKDHAFANLYLIEVEYKQIVKKTSQEPDSCSWGELINDAGLKGLYKIRKDRKYASLTVELYAVIEQLLKDIYHTFYDGPYVQTQDVNVILDLENKLSHQLKFENNTKMLADLRSMIIHEEFSLKKARKKENINLNNRKLFKQLLKDVENYIKKIDVTS